MVYGMRIYINIDSREVTTVPATLKFKGASVATMEVVFRNSSNAAVQLPEGVLPSFGLTSNGTLLAFVQDMEFGAGNVYSGDLHCSGETLLGMLSERSPQKISAEVLWIIEGQTLRSTTFSVSVEKPEIPNSPEALPDPILYPPASDILRKSLNLADLADKTAAFNEIKQAATAADSGVVQLASLSDVTVGANPLKVVPAPVLAQVVAGLPSRSVSTPRVLYIETNGNDATAEVGNPAKPFTAQGAYNWATSFVNRELANSGRGLLFRFGIGDFNIIVNKGTEQGIAFVGWPGQFAIAGQGHTKTRLNLFTPVLLDGTDGANGVDLIEHEDPENPGVMITDQEATGGNWGGQGESAPLVSITDAGVHSMLLSIQTRNGGHGGRGGNAGWAPNGDHPVRAGDGGSGGVGGGIILTNCRVGTIEVGAGGAAGSCGNVPGYGDPGMDGYPGPAGDIQLFNCIVQGSVNPQPSGVDTGGYFNYVAQCNIFDSRIAGSINAGGLPNNVVAFTIARSSIEGGIWVDSIQSWMMLSMEGNPGNSDGGDPYSLHTNTTPSNYIYRP